uniref:Putative homing endonuclease n=1 Tax=viral metagenome TaxID=1070528 RepID=A0A6M3J1G5_9ZZZZ
MKAIPDWPKHYVDKQGNVYSTWLHGKLKKLKPQKQKHGYLTVGRAVDKKYITVLVHRLVLETYVGSCPKGMECRHLNSNRHDNRLSNLRWGTRKENHLDAVELGTHSGFIVSNSRLTERAVIRIRELYRSTDLTMKQIGTVFGITDGAVCNIINRKCWSKVIRKEQK